VLCYQGVTKKIIVDLKLKINYNNYNEKLNERDENEKCK
jgi:hypothetical protein